MKKILLPIIAVALLGMLSACGQEKEAVTTDTSISNSASSESVAKYQAVIAGTETVAEYLDAFDISVKGVSQQDNIPVSYKNVERVGVPRQLNMEKIVSLNPDLFIGDKSLEDLSKEEMKKQDIHALYLDNSNYDNVLNSVKEIGVVFDKEKKADEIIENVKKKEKKALSGAESLKGKKVAILFGTGESYMLATSKSYLGSLLDKLGVENIAAKVSKAPSPYVKFSLESVVAENPDYILTLAHGHKEQAAKAFEAELGKELWKTTNAVKEGKTYALDDATFPVTGNIHVAETTEALKNLLKNGNDSK